MTAYRRWEKWSIKFEINSLPANSTSVAIFILNQIQMDRKFSSIHSFYYGLKYVHKTNNLIDPTLHNLVISMFEAARRLCKRTVTKKKPITIQHLQHLRDTLIDRENLKLGNFRTMVICVLGFCGFLRWSEASSIKRCDIQFTNAYMKIFIEKSKTDVYRDGHWVFISRSDSDLCPVHMLQDYLHLTDLSDQHSEQYIFRGITNFPKAKIQKLREKNTPISYTTVSKIFLQAIEGIGLQKSDFGLHSLRSGGATAAANAGVPDRLFKRHGRWRSETAKDGYVEDAIDSLLHVSRSLGI